MLPETPADLWDKQPTPIMQRDYEMKEAAEQQLQHVTIKGRTTDDENSEMNKQKRCGTKDFQEGKRSKRYTLQGTFWNSRVCFLVVLYFCNHLVTRQANDL